MGWFVRGVGAVLVMVVGCGGGDDTSAIARVHAQVCACKDQVCASAALATLPVPSATPSGKAKRIAAETLRCFADRPADATTDAGADATTDAGADAAGNDAATLP